MVKSILFAFAGCYALSGSPSIKLFNNNSPAPEVSGCALPAPKNIHLELTGTTYFQVAWDSVPEAAYFRVNLIRSSDGKLTVTKLVPAHPDNNRTLMTGLGSGVSYNVSIISVCSNGMESPKTF